MTSLPEIVEKVFADGTPKAIIVYADFGAGGTVRVACAGSKLEIQALMVVGQNQLLGMLEKSAQG